MTTLAWSAISLFGVFLLAAFGDVVSEEIRGWLDLAPRAILHLAAGRLDHAQRENIYEDEWLPELIYVLRGAESRPITRLIRGIRFAVGLLWVARRVASYRAAPRAATAAPVAQGHAALTDEQYVTFMARLSDGSIQHMGALLDVGMIVTGASFTRLRSNCSAWRRTRRGR